MTITMNAWNPHKPAAPGFGATLRAMREDAGLSQVKAAQATGFTHSYFSRMETGGRRPSPETVDTLVDKLNLSAVDRAGLYAAARMIPPGMACTVFVADGRLTLLAQEDA